MAAGSTAANIAKTIKRLNLVQSLVRGASAEGFIPRTFSTMALKSVRTLGFGGTAGAIIGGYRGYRESGSLGGAIAGAGVGAVVGAGAELILSNQFPHWFNQSGLMYGPLGRVYERAGPNAMFKLAQSRGRNINWLQPTLEQKQYLDDIITKNPNLKWI